MFLGSNAQHLERERILYIMLLPQSTAAPQLTALARMTGRAHERNLERNN